MIDRVSTSSVFSATTSYILRGQSELADLNRQISSGKKTDNFIDLGTDTARVISIEAIVSQNESSVQRNSVTKSRILQMDAALESLIEIASTWQEELVRERSVNRDTQDLTTIGANLMGQAVDTLNAPFNGRYLFAGSRTNSPPIDPSLVTNNIDPVSGRINDDFYQGDEVKITANINRTQTLEYGITANDESLQSLFAAINLGVSYETNNSETFLNDAIDLIDEAIDQLINTRAGLGLNLQSVEAASSSIELESLDLAEALGEANGVDVVAASVQISLIETTLQASLQTFSRISQLSLTNFLR